MASRHLRGPRLHFRPLPRRAALKTAPPLLFLNDSAWEGRRIFVRFPRSRSVDEKQPRNSILTEWIGMGRSGPQITAKRQLWDCVTLTMVLLSLLFRPGKCRFLFTTSPLPKISPPNPHRSCMQKSPASRSLPRKAPGGKVFVFSYPGAV